MRVAALDDQHRFVTTDLDDPTPGADDLVLRVLACGICGSDLKSYDAMPAGAVLGHEFCGEVVAVGTAVKGWREGQLVSAMPLSPCGRCRWCLTGDVAHCEQLDMIGLGGRPGGFAELVRVDPKTSVALPADVG